MIDTSLLNFIQSNQIDSFQKLRVLLFLHKNPKVHATLQELAERLHFGDAKQIEHIVSDLQDAGLISCINGRYKLRDEAELRVNLSHLASVFDHPLARQELIDRLRYQTSRALL